MHNRYSYGVRQILLILNVESKSLNHELSKKLGAKVDLTDRTGLGAAGEEFILKRAIYV